MTHVTRSDADYAHNKLRGQITLKLPNKLTALLAAMNVTGKEPV